MKTRTRILAVTLLVGCAGCSKDDNPYDIPPMVASSVTLTAYRSDGFGNVVDTLTFPYEPGVRVWLLEGDQRIDSTVTSPSGVYLFPLKVGHTYRTLAGIPPALTDTLPAFTVVDDLHAIYPEDTLSLKPSGVLTGWPNPSSGDFRLTFSLRRTACAVCRSGIWLPLASG